MNETPQRSSTRSVIRRLSEAFACDGFPQAPFYAFEHSLRFSLGEEIGGAVLRFLCGLDRARAVTREIFASSLYLTAVMTYVASADEDRSVIEKSFRAEIGFPQPLGAGERQYLRDAEHLALFGVDCCRYWQCTDFRLDAQLVDALLWASLTRETAIRPRIAIYLVDFERRIALHVYDDRGMDVFEMAYQPIRRIYNKFRPWLLDHDRPAMDAKFAL